MRPSSPLCGTTVAIGPSSAPLLQRGDPGASPALMSGLVFSSFLPFEMLLQLPEQKLHCYVVMALCRGSPRPRGAVSQQDHVRSRAVCVLSFFVLCVLEAPWRRARSNGSTDLGQHPVVALTRAARLH